MDVDEEKEDDYAQVLQDPSYIQVNWQKRQSLCFMNTVFTRIFRVFLKISLGLTPAQIVSSKQWEPS
jgi:hypothetical protein